MGTFLLGAVIWLLAYGLGRKTGMRAAEHKAAQERWAQELAETVNPPRKLTLISLLNTDNQDGDSDERPTLH